MRTKNNIVLITKDLPCKGVKSLKFFLIIGVVFYCYSCASIPKSDHCDGSEYFNNPVDSTDQSFFDHIKWLWEMETVEWPEWIDDAPQPVPPKYVGYGELRVTHINHATILIQIDSINILTDPIFSDYAGPISFLASKRVRKPGIAIDSLPKIDVILISHNHYDHLDLPTLEILGKRDKPLLLTGLGNMILLNYIPFVEIREMDWWDKYNLTLNNIVITFTPALHSSGRGFFDGNKTLWGGFVISNEVGNIYFAGDTGYGSFLNELHYYFPDFRLTIFPIGSYEKRWFMKKQHMNPDDAVKAHISLNSKQSIGMHYATFLEHPEQTIDQHEKDLETALNAYNLSKNEFIILKFGEGMDIP